MKIRQMVTDPEFAGLGLGRRVVEEAVAWAQLNGRHELIAHVRVVAQGFWMKMGFVAEPGSFEEVGLPHVRMVKKLIDE
jgi:predicted GNAT family N-acyltransferase